MNATTIPENHEPGPLLGLGSSEGLGQAWGRWAKRRVYEVACPHCRRPNTLPTGALCSHCGGTMGLFAGLHTLLVNDQGKPEIGYTRALSDAEVASVSMNPWQLYGVPGCKIAVPLVVAGPNGRAKERMMSDDDILKLATKCGAGWPDDAECELTRQQLLAFARAVESEVRERCAQIVDDMVRAVDGADALAAIRGAQRRANLDPTA